MSRVSQLQLNLKNIDFLFNYVDPSSLEDTDTHDTITHATKKMDGYKILFSILLGKYTFCTKQLH